MYTTVVLLILVFSLGLGVGSFVNVLVDRRERSEKILGRSYCESCRRILQWFELLPVVSFILQRGKCRACFSALSFQYPTVEILTGVLFVLVLIGMSDGGISAGASLLFTSSAFGALSFFFLLKLLFGFAVAALLVAILVYDFKHKIIPDEFSYLLALLAFAGILFQFFIFPESMNGDFAVLGRLLAGPVLALPFALLWFISGGAWMGLGDAKLTLGMGWILGMEQGITALVIAFWVGALVGVSLLFYERLKSVWGKTQLPKGENEFTMKSELPLGPFLILGLGIVFLFHVNFFVASLFVWTPFV